MVRAIQPSLRSRRSRLAIADGDSATRLRELIRRSAKSSL